MLILILGWSAIGTIVYLINARFFFLNFTKQQVREYYSNPSSLFYGIIEVIFWPVGLIRLIMRNIMRAVSFIASGLFGK